MSTLCKRTYKVIVFNVFFFFQAGFAILCMGFVVMALATPGGILSAMILFFMGMPFLLLGYYFWSVVRAAYLEILKEGTPTLPTLYQEGKKYQRM